MGPTVMSLIQVAASCFVRETTLFSGNTHQARPGGTHMESQQLRRWRHQDKELKASTSYPGSLRPAQAM